MPGNTPLHLSITKESLADDSYRSMDDNGTVSPASASFFPFTFFQKAKTADTDETKPKKKGLISLNQLNDKFMRSNAYLIIFAVLLYIAIGVAIYHHIMDWDRLNAFYFLCITVMSIGYGDYVPLSPKQRVFTAFYILLGIGICGTALGTISTFMKEHEEKMTKQRNLRAMLSMKEESNDHNIQKLANAMDQNNRGRRKSGSGNGRTESDDSSEKSGRRSRSSILSFAYNFTEPKTKTLGELRNASLAAYEEDYRRLKMATIVDFIVIFLVLIFGMAVMVGIEDWTTSDAFYWATVTVTTVGYGDVVPSTNGGKVFTIFYALVGCAVVAKALTDFVKFPLLSRVLHNEKAVVDQFVGESISPELLDHVFNNELHKLIPDLKRSEYEMSKCEFVLLVLQLMNKVEEKDIMLVAKLFDNLDKEHKGYFSQEDMKRQVNDARERANTMNDSAAPETPTALGRLRSIVNLARPG